MKHASKLLKSGLAGLLLSSVAVSAQAEDSVTFERLANPEPENWLSVYGNYQGWRYSELDEINADNVGDLRLAFAAPLSMRGGLGGNLQSAPLADDGFIYTIDLTGALVKIDTGSGVAATQLWRVETTPPEQQGRIQGPALWGDYVYSATRLGTVIAVERESGEVAWEVSYGIDGEAFDASPIALDDSIIVGQARGDWGTRGYVMAVDPLDGTEQWRFYTVPGPGEFGHDTWPQDNDAWMTGGAGIWIAPTYDPVNNLIFVGTGNAAPAWDSEFRAGDNLFASSTVVLDGDTGEIAWYFQYVPNDAHEKDAVSPHMLYDVEIDGETRQIFGHISRTGYFFRFDRLSGEFLGAEPAQSVIDWSAGIDPKTGKPVEYNPEVAHQRYAINPEPGEDTVTFCGGLFLTGTWPPAYDPERQLVYNTSADDSCYTGIRVNWEIAPVEERFGVQGFGGPLGLTDRAFRVNATNGATGEIVASADLPIELHAGVLATAGGVIFFGDSVGTFAAHDSDTLERLWSINLGAQMLSPPITYAVGGKQYVAIQTGGGPTPGGILGRPVGPNSSNLWVFAL